MKEKSMTFRYDINLYFSLQTCERVKFQDKVARAPGWDEQNHLVSFL